MTARATSMGLRNGGSAHTAAGTKRRSFHDRRIELDETFLGETSSGPSIEQRIVLEHANRSLHRIDRRSTLGEDQNRSVGGRAATLDPADVAVRAAGPAMNQDRPATTMRCGGALGQRPGAFHDHETLRCSIQPSSISKNGGSARARRGQPPSGDQVKHCDRRQRHPESDRRAVRGPSPRGRPERKPNRRDQQRHHGRAARSRIGAIETRPAAPTRCSSPLARTTMPRVVSNQASPCGIQLPPKGTALGNSGDRSTDADECQHRTQRANRRASDDRSHRRLDGRDPGGSQRP